MGRWLGANARFYRPEHCCFHSLPLLSPLLRHNIEFPRISASSPFSLFQQLALPLSVCIWVLRPGRLIHILFHGSGLLKLVPALGHRRWAIGVGTRSLGQSPIQRRWRLRPSKVPYTGTSRSRTSASMLPWWARYLVYPPALPSRTRR
eukprot:COSAG02_NODE_6888_length_3306_cov_3.325538_2_plen_148_part_00